MQQDVKMCSLVLLITVTCLFEYLVIFTLKANKEILFYKSTLHFKSAAVHLVQF